MTDTPGLAFMLKMGRAETRYYVYRDDGHWGVRGPYMQGTLMPDRQIANAVAALLEGDHMAAKELTDEWRDAYDKGWRPHGWKRGE